MHARIGQKWGGGLYAGSLHCRVTTITDRRMPRGRAFSVLSLAVWWAKLEKNDKVRHNMTQIASLLAVAAVFVDLWAPFYSQVGGLIRETKVPMQELELKMQGGLCARGGVIAGFYGISVPWRPPQWVEPSNESLCISLKSKKCL